MEHTMMRFATLTAWSTGIALPSYVPYLQPKEACTNFTHSVNLFVTAKPLKSCAARDVVRIGAVIPAVPDVTGFCFCTMNIFNDG